MADDQWTADRLTQGRHGVPEATRTVLAAANGLAAARAAYRMKAAELNDAIRTRDRLDNELCQLRGEMGEAQRKFLLLIDGRDPDATTYADRHPDPPHVV